MPKPLAFPPAARLRNPADFVALRREGKRFSTRCFQIQYRLTEHDGARLGMAVSRRVSKRAVVRNRIRRLIRESFRLRRDGLPACDVLAIASGSALRGGEIQLRGDLDALWSRIAALKPCEATRTIPPRS